MRIAIWGINYYPEQVGIGPHTTALSQFLANRGHEVRVHTSFAYYPAWAKGRLDAKRLFCQEKQREVHLIRTWHYVPKRPTPLRRVCHELSFAAFSFFPLLFGPRPEVLVVISPPLVLGFLAALWRMVCRVPLVVQIQDLQPDAAIALGMLQNPVLQAPSRFAERMTYRVADRVAAISRGMVDAIAKKGISADKLVFLPNGFDSLPLPARGQFRRHQGIPAGAFLIVYSGTLGAKQGLEKVLAAARFLSQQSVRLVICGDGPARQDVWREAGRNPVIHAMGLLPEAEYWEMLVDCDLCIIPQRTKVSTVFFPSKMLSAVAVECPVLVLADRECELARFVEQHDLGKVADEDHGQALAAQILALREDGPARDRFRRSAAQLKAQLGREKIFPGFEQELQRLSARPLRKNDNKADSESAARFKNSHGSKEHFIW
jgi:colanic acid biosynthesis glycosyl transferase WcaI